jgi:hypothetical protein
MNHSEAVKILEDVAARGFKSEAVTHWLNKEDSAQYVRFTDEEKAQIWCFLGDNPHLSRIGRHPIPSFFNKAPSRTISLLGRIDYAINGRHIGPEYVSGLAAELYESLQENSSLWEVAALNKLVS